MSPRNKFNMRKILFIGLSENCGCGSTAISITSASARLCIRFSRFSLNLNTGYTNILRKITPAFKRAKTKKLSWIYSLKYKENSRKEFFLSHELVFTVEVVKQILSFGESNIVVIEIMFLILILL